MHAAKLDYISSLNGAMFAKQMTNIKNDSTG